MNDLISRKTLYKTIHSGGFVGNPDDVGAVLNWVDQCIENVPAVSSDNFRISNFLEPCPFCGGKGDIIKSGTARSARKYHVCCDNERCMLFVGGRWYDTAEEAAEKWNARVYAAGGVRRI